MVRETRSFFSQRCHQLRGVFSYPLHVAAVPCCGAPLPLIAVAHPVSVLYLHFRPAAQHVTL